MRRAQRDRPLEIAQLQIHHTYHLECARASTLHLRDQQAHAVICALAWISGVKIDAEVGARPLQLQAHEQAGLCQAIHQN